MDKVFVNMIEHIRLIVPMQNSLHFISLAKLIHFQYYFTQKRKNTFLK